MSPTTCLRRTPWLLLALGAALLSACAAPVRERPDDRYLAVIQVEKLAGPDTADCPFSVKIRNRMPSTDWDGVSYHLALDNGNGRTIGKLIGAPRQHTRSGQVLQDTTRAANLRCGAIASVALVYFGYYPEGKRQVTLHNRQVRVVFRG